MAQETGGKRLISRKADIISCLSAQQCSGNLATRLRGKEVIAEGIYQEVTNFGPKITEAYKIGVILDAVIAVCAVNPTHITTFTQVLRDMGHGYIIEKLIDSKLQSCLAESLVFISAMGLEGLITLHPRSIGSCHIRKASAFQPLSRSWKSEELGVRGQVYHMVSAVICMNLVNDYRSFLQPNSPNNPNSPNSLQLVSTDTDFLCPHSAVELSNGSVCITSPPVLPE